MSREIPRAWEITPLEDCNGCAEIVIWDYDSDGEIEGSTIVVPSIWYDDEDAKKLANVLLAAPDLLEALENLMRVVANPDCAEGLALGSARAKATAAIARAKGIRP